MTAEPDALRLVPVEVAQHAANNMRIAYHKTRLTREVMVSPADLSVVLDFVLAAAPAVQPAAGREETDGLVDRFAEALKAKLRAAGEKYGFDDAWKQGDWREKLIEDLWRHVQKGDPRDVAAYCAFAWHHGWSLSLGDAPGSYWSECEDELSDAIGDSIDMDWTSRIGARAVVRWLDENHPRAKEVEQPCLNADEKAAQAGRCACRGADDMCPCQNAPDRQTLKDRDNG